MKKEQIIESLKILDLNNKDIEVYIALLSLGQSSIRKIAEKAGINRGTTYDSLKKLQEEGLISYYHKEKHQHFVAENPEKLKNIISRKKTNLEDAEENLNKIIPELYNLSKHQTNRPLVKFYENYSGIRSILEDILDSMENSSSKEYAVYSSLTIRPHLYHPKAFPEFNTERIKRKIHVKTIANGPGGTIYGKDERKWLSKKESSSTYILIYAGKVAMISLGKNNTPHGVIIEDKSIYETQLFIFNSLWRVLP